MTTFRSRLFCIVRIAAVVAAITTLVACSQSWDSEGKLKHQIGAFVKPTRLKLNEALQKPDARAAFSPNQVNSMRALIEYALNHQVLTPDEADKMILAYVADAVHVSTLNGVTQVMDFWNSTPEEDAAFKLDTQKRKLKGE